MDQLDLFPVTFTELQESLRTLREDHARIHRVLFHKIHALEERNHDLEVQIASINDTLLSNEIVERNLLYACN